MRRRRLMRGGAVGLVLVAACCKAAPDPVAPTDEPPDVARDARDLVELTLGYDGACGVFADHTAACWGEWGGGLINVTAPVTTLRDVVELRAGKALADAQTYVHHLCARDAAGGVWCWGNNRQGQVGRGNRLDTPSPERLTELPAASGLALGARHACVRTQTGDVWCWGSNAHGQVGGGSDAGDVVSPRRVEGVAGVTQLIAMRESTCALTAAHTVRCWGEGYAPVPTEVAAARGVRVLGVGTGPECGVVDDGGVRCWGYLGDLIGVDHVRDPSATITGIADATAVAVGSVHACALRASGEVWCWGRNPGGELGNGQTSADVAPPAPVTLDGVATALVAAGHHTCARIDDGRWQCWGTNVDGALGPPSTEPVVRPAALALDRVVFTAR